MEDKPKLVIDVRFELNPGRGDVVGVRRWLKAALRSYGLRCITIREHATTKASNSHDDATGDTNATS